MSKNGTAVTPGNEGWVKAGTVGVDTGRVIIADPCYAEAVGAAAEHDESDNDVLQVRNLGCAIASGYGDGIYPIYIKTDEEGVVEGLWVDFRLPA